jgi:hypothetical protein
MPASLARPVYDLVGWIVAGGTVIAVSQVNDAWEASTNAALNDPDKAARRIADDGGTWQEVSVVFTGTSLELYRQGVAVARANVPVASQRIDGQGQVHRMSIGTAQLGANLGTALALRRPGTPGPQLNDSATALPEKGIIDDLQLVRLGADQPQSLPNGVQARANYRLLIRPDGRLLDLTAAPPTGPQANAAIPGGVRWLFSGVSTEVEDYAAIDLNPVTGAVTSSRLTLSRSAP